MQTPKLAAAIIITLTFFSSVVYSQWFQQSSGVTSQLISVYFVNGTTGFACGLNGKVLRTTNAGVNWNSSTILDTIVKYNSIFFINVSTGYIAGSRLVFDSIGITAINPIVIKTTDNGLNWVSVLHDTLFTLWSISFINDNTGFAVGGLYGQGPNKLIKTTDAGASWQGTTLGNGYANFITFKDPNTGYITANGGDIFRTTNAGANWNLLNNLAEYQLFSAAFIDNNTGFAAGGNFTDTTGNIYRTTDGGATWAIVYTDHNGTVDQVTFVNSSTGFAVGPLATLETTFPGMILKTTNAGNNWFIDTLFTNQIAFRSLFFTDQSTGYVVGGNGVILKSTTGGNLIGITQLGSEVPKVFSLSQNYPNPFNPSTKIKFALPKSSFAKLSIYDMLGREVSQLVNENLTAGTYEVNWNADNFSSGVYFYKLETQSYTKTMKMALIK